MQSQEEHLNASGRSPKFKQTSQKTITRPRQIMQDRQWNFTKITSRKGKAAVALWARCKRLLEMPDSCAEQRRPLRSEEAGSVGRDAVVSHLGNFHIC